jgi:hypothetical protein
MKRPKQLPAVDRSNAKLAATPPGGNVRPSFSGAWIPGAISDIAGLF